MSADQEAEGQGTDMPAGDRWGEAIGAERAAWLQTQQEAWRPGRPDRPGPFAGETLSGADVFWLAVRALAGPGGDVVVAERRLREATGNPLLQVSLDLSRLDLQQAILSAARLEGATLGRAQLEGATLGMAHLERAFLGGAQLKGALLDRASLDGSIMSQADLSQASLWATRCHGADLYAAHLNDSIVRFADLRDADLRTAGLERADLAGAYLQGANLTDAHLSEASLYEAHLESAIFTDADLRECDLRRASLDATTRLNGAQLNGAALDQAHLHDTNLAVVEWRTVDRLGDEALAREPRERVAHYDLDGRLDVKMGPRKPPHRRAEEYRAAARAYRSLSVVLREQGLARDATRFHYAAEVMTRRSTFADAQETLRSRRFLVAPVIFAIWLLSLALSAFAGYGVYHVWRLALTYLGVVGVFAGIYYLAGQQAHQATNALDAIVLSLTSFHGRGLQPSSGLTDSMRVFAGFEAVTGLLIEGLFIAAFTRRVTGA